MATVLSVRFVVIRVGSLTTNDQVAHTGGVVRVAKCSDFLRKARILEEGLPGNCLIVSWQLDWTGGAT